MDIKKSVIGIEFSMATDFATALSRVTEELKTEGFGVLTEIDVKATLKQKLGIDFRPYNILGACNPTLAHRALQIAPEIGLLLPCNVTVSQNDDDQIQVAIIDPGQLVNAVQNPALESVAQEAMEKLTRVAQALAKDS